MTEQEWLEADNHKIILVDISYHDGTSLSMQYFGSYPYILKYGDSFTNILGNTVSSICYDDILLEVPVISTRMDSSQSLGSITLLNTDGNYDSLLDITNSWEGHTIQVYMGDPTWARNQFILILEGITDSVTAPEQHLIKFDIRDKKEALNVSVQSATIWDDDTDDYLNDGTGSTGIYDKFPTMFVKNLYDVSGTSLSFNTSLGVVPEGNKNTNVPICLGKVFNISPVLVDAYNHVYQIHECPDNTNYGISEVTEVRANGVKLTGPNDANLDELIDTGLNGTGTTLTVTRITGDVIDSTETPWTATNAIRGVIRNITLDESRYIITYTDSNTVTVDTNAANQSAQTAGWTTGHTYEYWVSTTAPSVRALQYEENLLAGCIRLLVHSQSTEITCDIIGSTTRTQYADTVGVPDVIAHSAAFILEYLALEKTSLTSSDICPHTFSSTGSSAFTNTDSLGIYLRDETVLSAIQETINSVGGYIRFERTCVLQIFRFIDPIAETSVLTITEDSVLEKGLKLTSIELPEKSVNLGYKKNWTVQDRGAIAGAVLESDNLDFLEEITSEYSNVIDYTGVSTTEYPLITDADLKGTFIFTKANATTEADRRATLRSQKRYVYKLETITAPFTLNVGDVITIEHNRYGFDYPGKKALVIGLEEFPTDKRVNLEVWV